MLAADAATHCQTFLQDGGAQLLHPRLRLRLTGVVENQGVKVAVAGVKDIGDGKSVILAQAFDGGQHGRQAAAGNNAILDVIGGSDLSHGGEGRLAPFPEHRALRGVLSKAQAAGPGMTTQLLSPLR